MASQPIPPANTQGPSDSLWTGRGSAPEGPNGETVVTGHLLSVPFNRLVAVGWCHLLVSKKRRGKEGLLVRFSAALPSPYHHAPPPPRVSGLPKQ